MLRLLPTNLVNQIAAGEVVERPASAVKELVENAIDAGAHRIAITLKEGGRTFLLVVDDGIGMTRRRAAARRRAPLHLQAARTTISPTSVTLGFRGEALPSIASVSRFTITSRPAGADTAWSLAIDGGAKGKPDARRASGRARGSKCAIFSLPRRRGSNSSRSRAPKSGHVADAMRRLAMAHPDDRLSGWRARSGR